jgi:hypothetical protein
MMIISHTVVALLGELTSPTGGFARRISLRRSCRFLFEIGQESRLSLARRDVHEWWASETNSQLQVR